MIEIEIGGRLRKFSFGLEVLGWIQKDSGLDLAQAGNTGHSALFFIYIKSLLYRGHERELKKQGKYPDYTMEDVDTWLLDKGVQHPDVLRLWACFNQTLTSMLPPQQNPKTQTAEKKR